MMSLKLVIINRGVPGSGKTFALKYIKDVLDKNSIDSNYNLSIHSTDAYFMQDDKYVFDATKLSVYHQKNIEDFERSLTNKICVVVCDNTNLLPWQTENYTSIARKYNYKILFINYEPKSLDELRQIQKSEKSHHVPDELLERNIEEFQIYNDLLYKHTEINTLRHRQYVWNNEKQCREDIGEAKHFDLDYLINLPHNWDKNTVKSEFEFILNTQKIREFDYVFHTCGAEKMPIVWGIRELRAKNHVCIHAKNFSSAKDTVKKFATNTYDIEVDAFDPKAIETKILDFLEKNEARNRQIAFNLTGGTKTMLLAGLNVVKKLNKMAKAYYVDGKNNIFTINDSDNFIFTKLAPISKVETFVKASTNGLKSYNKANIVEIKKRAGLTNALYNYRASLNEIYNNIPKDKSQKANFINQNFDAETNGGAISIGYKKGDCGIDDVILAKFENQSSYKISSNRKNELLNYITGGWFEEYIYLQLEPLMIKGMIYDLQINTSIYENEVLQNNIRPNAMQAYNEFDLLFTDGYKLYIVECKSTRNIKEDFIYKLDSNRSSYGGLSAVVILATSTAKPNETQKRRLKDKGVKLITDNFAEKIEGILKS